MQLRHYRAHLLSTLTHSETEDAAPHVTTKKMMGMITEAPAIAERVTRTS